MDGPTATRSAASKPSVRGAAAEAAAVQLDLLTSSLELSEDPAAAPNTGVRIEHTYPAAREFLRRHGPETLAVLHDVLAEAEWRHGELVVRPSVRRIAEGLGFISKDTVHRRLRVLIQAGVLRRSTSAERHGATRAAAFVVDLSGTAIAVTVVRTALPTTTLSAHQRPPA